MRSLVVDDSRLAASALVKVVTRVDAQGACDVAYSASDANRMCMEHPYDVVFLDIEMPGANGLTLANRLRLQSPQTNVVFVTGYPEYALDAWNTQASCFLVKVTVFFTPLSELLFGVVGSSAVGGVLSPPSVLG